MIIGTFILLICIETFLALFALKLYLLHEMKLLLTFCFLINSAFEWSFTFPFERIHQATKVTPWQCWYGPWYYHLGQVIHEYFPLSRKGPFGLMLTFFPDVSLRKVISWKVTDVIPFVMKIFILLFFIWQEIIIKKKLKEKYTCKF